MTRWGVMLRGINVGGRHRVAMAELRELLAGEGYADVATYVQSGNVVLSGGPDAAALETDLARLIGARFDFAVPVTARTSSQLDAVLARDPLPGAAQDPRHYVVTFVADAPDAAGLERLAGLATAGERLHADGRELYSHHPQGQARSKLAAALTGPGLGASATARNWATVTRLAQMARG